MKRQKFAPADGLSIRDPLDDNQRKGNIMNPRRVNSGEVGGFGLNARGLGEASDGSMEVKNPSSTQRRYPHR